MNGKKKDGKKKQATPKDATPGEGYEVGYKKPPLDTRFQPGQSGNPRGRPKGTNNLKTDLLEELSEKILVREGDQAQRVSKQRAVVKTLVARTLKGDARAAGLLLSTMTKLLDLDEEAEASAEPLTEDDLEVLRNYEARLRRDAAEHQVTPDAGTRPESKEDLS